MDLGSGPMAEAVSHSTSQMTDDDLAAIADYLKDRDSSAVNAAPAPYPVDQNTMRAGSAIYKDNCSVCHRGDGTGDI
jgi:mono/diheme cytochrome c family protein